jgi:cytidylate kinase
MTVIKNENSRVEAITIDGPAASGKSTVAIMLAKRLGYLFFDTGVMYRAVTLGVQERGLDVNDNEYPDRWRG